MTISIAILALAGLVLRAWVKWLMLSPDAKKELKEYEAFRERAKREGVPLL